MKTARTTVTLLAGLALATAPVLTACSQSGPSSDLSSSSASDSSADSTRNDTKDKDGKSPTSDTSSGQTEASAKAGDTQEVTSPTSGVTFAVPKDWVDLKNLDSSDKETVAQSMGIDSATLDQQTSALDIFYRAKEPDSSGFYNNVNMEAQTLLLGSTPSEFDITSLLTRQHATLKNYSTKQTANGEAAVATYTLQVGGKSVAGTIIMAPTSQPAAGYANYASIYVSAGSEQESEQIASTIISTFH